MEKSPSSKNIDLTNFVGWVSMLTYIVEMGEELLIKSKNGGDEAFVLGDDFLAITMQYQLEDELVDEIVLQIIMNLKEIYEHAKKNLSKGRYDSIYSVIKDEDPPFFYLLEYEFDEEDDVIRFVYFQPVELDEYLDAIQEGKHLRNNEPPKQSDDERDENKRSRDKNNRTLPSSSTDSDSER